MSNTERIINDQPIIPQYCNIKNSLTQFTHNTLLPLVSQWIKDAINCIVQIKLNFCSESKVQKSGEHYEKNNFYVNAVLAMNMLSTLIVCKNAQVFST